MTRGGATRRTTFTKKSRLGLLVGATLLVSLVSLVAWIGCGGTSSESEEEGEDEAIVAGCGTERWAVKTGTDPDVGKVNLAPADTTIAALLALTPPKTLPSNGRIAPTEEQVFRLVDVNLSQFKLEADSDIHLIVTEGASTMNVEIPAPKCVGATSPFAASIAKTRATFTAKYTPSTNFTTANETISVLGVGFFDNLHGQRGGAPNGIELHGVLDICFGKGCALGGGPGDGGVDSGHGDGGAPGSLASVKTVFVVMMENHNWTQIKGSASAPYVNGTLLPMGAHAENYQNVPGIHPSEPNYIWLESGDNLGITTDNLPSSNHQSTTNHLVTLLEQKGITWKAYAEGASGASCPVSNSGLYAPKHVPFVFFDDVRNDAARCTQHVRPFTELASDLAAGAVAQYNFITPDLCDDMHNSTGCATADAISNGDTWLSKELPKIFASSAYKKGGAVFLTFDESEGGDHAIAMIVLSPFAKPGYGNAIAYDHSSTLRTVQEIFGATPFLRAAATATDLSDLFLPGGGGEGDAGSDSGGVGDAAGDAAHDASSDAGQDAGQDAGGGTSCSHPFCAVGSKLVTTCDPCVATVCAQDSFCCAKSWDSQCVGEVASACGVTCP